MRVDCPELLQWDAPEALECSDLMSEQYRQPESPALDALQLEFLMLNLAASLRVYARPHFFMWTQGLLQSLIRHEVLICALRAGESLSFRVDSFSTLVPNAGIFSELLLRDSSAAASLVKDWKERRFRPLVSAAGDGSPLWSGAFARELERVGATQAVMHGNHDANGEVSSFFVFACQSGVVNPRLLHIVQLVVPHMHSAWVRSQICETTENTRLAPAGGGVLTPREQEILRWIYLGKSNGEVGAILAISPLTVKNHVQKILRKLHVVNRTQAVGKALDARILCP